MRKTVVVLWLFSAVLFGSCAGPQVYFSPQGGVEECIVDQISDCRRSLDVAVYSITSPEIAQALLAAHKRGVKIRVISDKVQSSGTHSKTGILEENGIPCKIMTGQKGGLMHNKFAIFDGQTVLTGSHNWTQGAENKNYENTLVLKDRSLIWRYQQEFETLWQERDRERKTPR